MSWLGRLLAVRSGWRAEKILIEEIRDLRTELDARSNRLEQESKSEEQRLRDKR